jgi:hypothetical protein
MSNNPLRYDYSRNTWVGQGSREMNNNHIPQPPLSNDEISSLSLVSTESRTSSVNLNNSLNSNNSVSTTATLSSSASAISPFPTCNSNFNPPSNLYDTDSIYNNALDVDIDADEVYKPRRELKSTTLKYTTTKNKNKYGKDYDHHVPDLTEYRSRTT